MLIHDPCKLLNVVQHDIHLCAYSALLQIVAKFHDEIFSDPSTPSGLNKVRTKNTLFVRIYADCAQER